MARGRMVAARLGLALVAGCFPGRGPVSTPVADPQWTATLAELAVPTFTSLPAGPTVPFTPGTVVVLDAPDWREPVQDLRPEQTAGLRQFLVAGGRLLLLGHATTLAPALTGCAAPQATPYRWGYDARTVRGDAWLGFEVVSGRHPELFEGLGTADDPTFFVTGGAPCCVPHCVWQAAPEAEVLAGTALVRDGERQARGGAALVHWQLGAGRLLAAGLRPDLGSADAAVQANARRFVRNCVASLGAAAGAPVVVVRLELLAPEVSSPPTERGTPEPPLLAHWGWVAAPTAATGEVHAPAAVLDDVLLRSWAAGATGLEVELTAPNGLPLRWGANDPLRRPASYRSDELPGWGAEALRQLAAEAHARGMLLHGGLPSLPVGNRFAERLALLRFLGRELGDRRRFGEGAIDGFGLGEAVADPAGLLLGMVQDFQPTAFLYRAGERQPRGGGALPGLDAADGALPGFGVNGLSANWRDGFPADRAVVGVLDAAAWRAPGATTGGGSFGDWVVTQANDFVRTRRDAAGVLWWRRHEPTTAGLHTVDYVHGVSQVPLRAAVAMPLAATGSGGYRAAVAALATGVPTGFGAEVEAPCSVHVLQNNWFRLHGSGGALLYDPTGTARWRGGQSLLVSPGLLRSRLFGGRPDAESMRGEIVDLLAAGLLPAGGHGRCLLVGGPRRSDRRLPEQLAFGRVPEWPEDVAVEWHPSLGYHELEVQPRAIDGQGVLVIRLDDTVLQCLPFGVGRTAERVVVPVHVAQGGQRRLRFTVTEGGCLTFDRLRVLRTGDVAAEARVQVPAGHLAQLGERSASSYHVETTELTAVADWPGLLLRIHTERAVRNLQVERSLGLPHHGVLRHGGPADDLRQPFVLGADTPDLPDLVVVPLQLPAGATLRLQDGQLLLRCAPSPGQELKVGLLLASRAEAAALADHGLALFADLERPRDLELGAGGEALLLGDQPVAVPRVLRLRQRAATPYAVEVDGWWTWRGAQATADGDLLGVRLPPGGAVRVVGGASLLARTRPGPGATSTVALRDPAADRATVRVLAPNRLVPPSVVFAQDFASVRVDGRPWAWFAGRTVFLPDKVGSHEVVVAAHRGEPEPHVAWTRAPLLACEYSPERRELRLSTGPDPGRPVELPYTAVLHGPVPKAIDHGEVVPEPELRHVDAAAQAAAAQGGVLIRFRPGVTRIRYGDG